MMNNKSLEIQHQIRQQALQLPETLKDLKKWESEMSKKEAKVKGEISEQQQTADQSQVIKREQTIYDSSKTSNLLSFVTIETASSKQGRRLSKVWGC